MRFLSESKKDRKVFFSLKMPRSAQGGLEDFTINVALTVLVLTAAFAFIIVGFVRKKRS